MNPAGSSDDTNDGKVNKARRVQGLIRCDDVRVPLSDGTLLATDIIVPDKGQPYPALLIRGPYARISARSMIDFVSVARAGWAVVMQDCRGRFDSSGDFEPFHHERHDGAEVIAWVAEQPWCDGRVATYGPSYLGITQLFAALEKPPALKAMAPIVTGGDIQGRWMYEGGAFELGFAAFWAAYLTLTDSRLTDDERSTLQHDVEDWDEFFHSQVKQDRLASLMPAFDNWRQPSPSTYWNRIRFSDDLHEVDVPCFHVAGWYDVFAEPSLETFRGFRQHGSTSRARSGQRLVIGPWTHTGLFQRSSAEFDFGSAADMVAGNLPGEIIAWLRDVVDGKQPVSGVRAYVMGGWGKGHWVELADWPPCSTAETWYLNSSGAANGVHGNGALSRHPPATKGSNEFIHDADCPVPTCGGRTLGPFFPQAGPVNQSAVEEREDVLVYTSDPLVEQLEVMGRVTMDICFETSAPRTADIVVKLCDVYPDGRSYNVLDSIRRVGLKPGEPTFVSVDLGSVAQRFQAGHRLRVQVAATNFPRFACNPDDGRSCNTVHWGGEMPSRLILPVTSG